MMHASLVLVNILRGAWGAITGLMVAVALLAALAQLVKLAGGAELGAAMVTARAAGSILALIVVVLYTFLAIPAIVHAVSSSKSVSGGCGPAAGLGQAAAYAMAAITALRMARAAFVSMFSALGGASEGIAYAIGEAAEAVVGMVLISVAVPVAAALLGAC